MNFYYFIGHSLSKIFAKTFLSYKVKNTYDSINSIKGSCIIASNHSSFLDPPLIGIALSKPIFYFARKSLFKNPIFNFILKKINALPINQEKPDLSSIKNIISLLKKGEKVLIFPEGTRSFDGSVQVDSAQQGVGMIINKTNAPVLPVRIIGTEKALPRGSKKITRAPVKLIVGKLIKFDDILLNDKLTTKEKYKEISTYIMMEINNLK